MECGLLVRDSEGGGKSDGLVFHVGWVCGTALTSRILMLTGLCEPDIVPETPP